MVNPLRRPIDGETHRNQEIPFSGCTKLGKGGAPCLCMDSRADRPGHSAPTHEDIRNINASCNFSEPNSASPFGLNRVVSRDVDSKQLESVSFPGEVQGTTPQPPQPVNKYSIMPNSVNSFPGKQCLASMCLLYPEYPTHLSSFLLHGDHKLISLT